MTKIFCNFCKKSYFSSHFSTKAHLKSVESFRKSLPKITITPAEEYIDKIVDSNELAILLLQELETNIDCRKDMLKYLEHQGPYLLDSELVEQCITKLSAIKN